MTPSCSVNLLVLRRVTVEEVRSLVELVDLVGEYVPTRSTGTHFVAPCPFHDDEGESLAMRERVFVDYMQVYRCEVCNAHGDVLGFYEAMEGLTYGEALLALGARVGVKVPKILVDDPWENRWPPRNLLHFLGQQRLPAGEDMLTTTWLGDDHRPDPTQGNLPTRERWRFDCVAPDSYRRVTERGRHFGETYDRCAAIAATASYLLHEGRSGRMMAVWRAKRWDAQGDADHAHTVRCARAALRRVVRIATRAIDSAERRAIAHWRTVAAEEERAAEQTHAVEAKPATLLHPIDDAYIARLDAAFARMMEDPAFRAWIRTRR